MKNQHPNPRTDDDALVIHADRMAGMSEAQRNEYLDEFSGKQDPPPADNYEKDGRGKSLRDLLGETGTAALIAQADEIAAKRQGVKP